MATTPAVGPTTDVDRALATMTVAFSNDPIVRWVLPDAERYVRFWPRLVHAFGGVSFDAGSADSIDDCAAVAMWVPPGAASDEETIGELLGEALSPQELDSVLALMGQLDEFHPSDPHWYLPTIAVDVTKHGLGYGSALLAHALDRCRVEAMPAYLEATTPRSRALYERHGFKEIGVIQAGDSPPLWPMLFSV